MRQMFFGVDVGGTRLRVMGQDAASGHRTHSVEVSVPRTVNGMLDSIIQLVESITDGATPRGIAVGLPGQVLGSRCVWIPNLRHLDGVHLGCLIAQRLGAPCALINDAQASLIAETREGAVVGQTNTVLIAVGTGIGGAYQFDGRLARGTHGCAGSFGWLTMPGGSRDEDHGEWEQLGAGRALERLARQWGSTEGLLEAARRGNADALSTVNEYGAVLGHGAAALASILDPGVIVFAGGVSKAFDLLAGPIKAALHEHASPAGRTINVVPAVLGGQAGVIGALHLALEDDAAIGTQPSTRPNSFQWENDQ